MRRASAPSEPDVAARVRGCLLAGAVGDALGARLERFLARYPGY